MTSRVWILALALLIVPAAAIAAPSHEMSGTWVGGFLYREDWITVILRVDAGSERITGTADVSFADYEWERGVPLDSVLVEGERLRFILPLERGRLSVNGRITGDVLSGTCVFAHRSHSFGLVHTIETTPEDRSAYYGAYELAPGHIVAVFDYSGTNLRFIDYHSGQQHTLYPVSKDSFVSGPGQTMAFPIAHTFLFIRDDQGRVTRLQWHPTARAVRSARRVAYREVAMTCENGPVKLGGTLILPERAGPYPAIIVTPGDFGSSRDALRGYAFGFVRRGIAALVFDSRGANGSTGPLASSTFPELAEDVLAWVKRLQQEKDLDPAKIGLFGFSNSSWTVLLAASRSKDVAFLIPQSTSALPVWKQERFRAETQVRLARFPPDVVAKAVRFMDLKFEVARTGQGWDSLQAIMGEYARTQWLAYTNPPSTLERLRQYWDRSFSYDPEPALTHVTCPTLFIFGGLDSNVPVDASIPIIKSAMTKAGNHSYWIRIFPLGRHDLIEGKNGGPIEFPRMPRFAPGYWDAMGDWVVKTTGGATH